MSRARIITAFIATILIISIISVIGMNFLSSNGNLTAKIYQDGILLHTIELNKVTESYEIHIPDVNGSDNWNIVLVENGCISMKDASCPDHICVKTGKITSSLMPITCLPNKVVIYVSSDSAPKLDSVAY